KSESGPVTTPGVKKAFAAAAARRPGSRVSSWFNTQNHVYLSKDRNVTFQVLYPPGASQFNLATYDDVAAALKAAAPPGVTTYVTGIDPLYNESSGGETSGPSVLVETLVGALGALVILLFTFGTLPAIAFPLMVAGASILNTFTLILALTYIT